MAKMLKGQLNKVIIPNCKIKLKNLFFSAKSHLVELMFTLFKIKSEFHITVADLDNMEAQDRYKLLLPSADCHYRNLIKIFDRDENGRISHREWLSFYG